MSDVGINIPARLALIVLSVDFWPVVVALELAAIAAAFFVRGPWRLLFIALAVLFAADLAVAGMLALNDARFEASARAGDQSVKTTLTAAQTVDGLALPAGTAVTWSDPTHTQVIEAVLPVPATLLGVKADRVQRSVDGGWVAHLAGPQSVGGWTCQPDLVELEADGGLRRCALASERNWNGWMVAAATLVAPHPADHTIGFVFPADAPVMAREIGRNLPATGGMSMNEDGSLNSVYFDAEASLAVCGASLWNTVTWRYDAATLGQGRERKPVGVSGASPAGEAVEFALPGCK